MPRIPTQTHHCCHAVPIRARPAASSRIILPPLTASAPLVLARAEVKRLEKENEDLLRRQAVAEARSNMKQEKVKSDTLRSLLGQRDEVEQQIAQEKKRIAQLDKEVCRGRLRTRYSGFLK